jgi:hypothetical protein
MPTAAPVTPTPASRTAPLTITSPFGQLATLLALAVHRQRTYPSTNPLLAEALKACHRAVTSFDEEQIVLRVSQRTLLLDDVPLVQTPGVSEFASLLHQGGVAALTLFRDASLRDIACLCREIAAQDQLVSAGDALPDRLRARGVDKVQVDMQLRPAVIEAGMPHSAVLSRLFEDQAETEARAVPSGRLYRPDKGWVRVDPSVLGLESVSLTRLAELVADPMSLAATLAALADEPTSDPTDALENKFKEVVMLMRSAEPAVATALLGRLARAVLGLDPDRRQSLIRNTILPGLLDGSVDAALMRQFPDVDLAESLSLLLDLQVAAPEILRAALDRLDLPTARRARLEPLLNERLLTRKEAGSQDGGPGRIDGLDRGQIRVDLSSQKEFRNFASYDLAIDAQTDERLIDARDAIATTRGAVERARCLVHLLRFEANPEASGRLLTAVLDRLRAFVHENDLSELATWVHALRDLQAGLQDNQPEIAGLIAESVLALADDSLIDRLVRASEAELPTDAAAARILDAFGPACLPALVAALDREGSSARRTAIRKTMCVHALALASGVAEVLPAASPEATRALVAVLGRAGHGHERTVGGVLRHPDGRVAREAVRALVEIGTPEARRLVMGVITEAGDLGRLAEDAMWQFADGRASACDLLGRTDFVLAHSAIARRLLLRAAERSQDDLAPIARQLSRLRTHFWRPAQMRLGFAAARIGKTL